MFSRRRFVLASLTGLLSGCNSINAIYRKPEVIDRSFQADGPLQVSTGIQGSAAADGRVPELTIRAEAPSQIAIGQPETAGEQVAALVPSQPQPLEPASPVANGMPYSRYPVVKRVPAPRLETSPQPMLEIPEYRAVDEWRPLAGRVTDVGAYRKEVRHFSRLVKRVNHSWGKRETRVASTKVIVKYTDNYHTRCIIDLQRGIVRVETLEPSHLHNGIVTTVLSPLDPSSLDLFSAQDVTMIGVPFLHKQVLDEDVLPIRWTWRANRFARYQIRHNLKTTRIQLPNGEYRTKSYVEFPLGRNHESQRKHKYSELVDRYARKYGQDRALVYAIIETESHFNPYATSWVPAYGLMQVVPRTAGRDAYRLIHGRSGTPTRQYLFNPENCIRMGTAYLSILQNRYLAGIRNPLSLEYCMIAAYNGGAGNVLRSFSKNKKTAFRKINQMTPEQVYRVLRTRMPKESQGYLKKVTQAKPRYA